jgi:hypothetical protein
MRNMGNGRQAFDDMYEMYYNMFTTIGLSINKDGYLYDQDTGIVLRFKDKFIKAPNLFGKPVYASANDIMFDPKSNYQLMTNMFGYYIDKLIAEDEIKYIAQYVEDEKINREPTGRQRVVVRTAGGDIASDFFNNGYLGYIQCIFYIDGTAMDLYNLDIVDAI